jgi:hypothetical protein
MKEQQPPDGQRKRLHMKWQQPQEDQGGPGGGNEALHLQSQGRTRAKGDMVRLAFEEAFSGHSGNHEVEIARSVMPWN